MVLPPDRGAAIDSVLMRNLPDHIVETLLGDTTIQRYGRGETGFMQGEKARIIHIVLDGWVKLHRVAPNGHEAIVNVFTGSNSFGEAVAFKHEDYPVSAEAVTECRLPLIPSHSLAAMMKEAPELLVSVLASTFQHLHDMVFHLEQIAGRLGIKPDSLSRAFSKLQELGVKIARNRASISDIDALRDYANVDPASVWKKAL